jgi:hypothetical protein
LTRPLSVWSLGSAIYGFSLLFFALALNTLCLAASSNSEEQLRGGAEEFIRLIEARDQTALLSLISEQGTSFVGTAYVPSKASLTPGEIRKDFEGKTGVYCLFFDTECFRHEDLQERIRQNGRPLRTPLRSIADLLSTARQKKLVTYDISKANGKVSVLLSSRTPDTARLGEDALNFYFRLEDGKWKLRNVEYN